MSPYIEFIAKCKKKGCSFSVSEQRTPTHGVRTSSDKKRILVNLVKRYPKCPVCESNEIDYYVKGRMRRLMFLEKSDIAEARRGACAVGDS